MNISILEKRLAVSEKIKASKLVAIIRLKNEYQVAKVVECLVTAGVSTLEVTANTPGYCQAIREARATYPNALVGAGTITNIQRAESAIEAGAQFIVTPNTNKDVVELAHAHGLPVLMGALTPTEVAEAIEFKADFIKIFPAGSLGVKYFKDLQGPFSGVPFMPVGGVNLDNITDWFNAGAVGVGVGNDLTRAVTTENEKLELIKHIKSYLSKLPME
ncbi:bifunctional 4-hydroxy-2-oxoglutarate aldolase/2-dehydro-3-deoxy-phosphogluconate aldolase [Catenovulum maritimum]|uniref:2-dehydro-3-deoxyphosphogluconate aldolase n=1 Tax=Catenovulum maritimum TaxID=1513271 RepID=A0A0J8GVQ2_9ALTE|nr:bifunctional 4-hydroxy-2-oxoglutarate aldolase/2-dehydro-3-deoxy-phosphogluconate aldolase [Catenovulum maritimum]KMT66827.1 2-dehydro-3-deoxyphosphogluconate aldolase [Catenovulum maritimum]